MKLIAALFVLLIPGLVRGDPTTIIAISNQGDLTWRNSETGEYCGVEWVPDLNYLWFPYWSSSWNLRSTSTVQTVRMDLDVMSALTSVSAELNRKLTTPFFRITTSANPINSVAVTNWIRVINMSDNVLTNVAIGVKTGQVFTTNAVFGALLSGSATTPVAVTWLYGPLDTIGSGSVWDGWFLKYGQDGSNHLVGTVVFFIGPARKDVSVTVSNTGSTTRFDWFGDMSKSDPY